MKKNLSAKDEAKQQSARERIASARAKNARRPLRKKKKRGCLPYLLIFCLFVIAACAGAIFASSSLFDKPTITKKNSEQLLYAQDKSIIMIMGIDEHIREDDAGRSDTLMIASLDPKKNQAALLSIPRDTRVKIPRYGYDKINAAYAIGGKKLTQETVENFLSLPIDHYVAIKTNSFCRIIDAIGGVDIDVEKRMFYEDPWDDNGGLVIDLQPGKQHMDGKTAITYVRYRDEEGDIGRVKRQQKFMKAVMDQVASPMIIPRLPSIIREVSKTVDTDLSVRQLLELAGSLKEAQKNGLKTEMIQGTPMYIDDISYWVPDISDVRTALAETLDIKLSAAQISAMEREEFEYNSSLSGSTVTTDTSRTESGSRSDSSKKTEKKQSIDDILKGRISKPGTTASPSSARKQQQPVEEDDEEENEEPAKPQSQNNTPNRPTAPSFNRSTGKKL